MVEIPLIAKRIRETRKISDASFRRHFESAIGRQNRHTCFLTNYATASLFSISDSKNGSTLPPTYYACDWPLKLVQVFERRGKHSGACRFRHGVAVSQDSSHRLSYLFVANHEGT